MALYPIVAEMKKLLVQMTTWIDKAEVQAASKGYDPVVLLQARLAPDMFPFVRQVQSVCDQGEVRGRAHRRQGSAVAPRHRGVD